MISFFKKLLSFVKRQDDTSSENRDNEPIIFSESESDIDISTIVDLSQQKVLCTNMLEVVKLHESKLKNRFIGVQTVSDFIQCDRKVREEMGEFVGYHFGCISSAMLLVDSAMMNLKRFEEGDFDNIDAPARGMFVSMWYNIALSNIQLLDNSINQIENIEVDLIHQEMERTGSNEIVLKRGTVH